MSYHELNLEERITIRMGLLQSLSLREIARQINRSPSTVSCEIRRNSDANGFYTVYDAEQKKKARRVACRPKCKLLPGSELFELVKEMLRDHFSPKQKLAIVPMGFLTADTVSTNLNLIIPEATKYEFGVLTSQMHMDWMRTVAGRLKSDYRYSAQLVYNNFVWPEATDTQKKHIEALAQSVLDARQVEFDLDAQTSLADLYDPDLMPPALRKAHVALDKAVDKLYNPKGFKSPMERVQCLFTMYAQSTA